MPLTARDIMQSQVITVSSLDPVHVVQRLFFEEEIHGAPVVDEEGRCVVTGKPSKRRVVFAKAY